MSGTPASASPQRIEMARRPCGTSPAKSSKPMVLPPGVLERPAGRVGTLRDHTRRSSEVRSGLAWYGAAMCLVVAGLLLPGSALAKQAVNWIESYEEAMAESRRTGKPIFLEFRCAP